LLNVGIEMIALSSTILLQRSQTGVSARVWERLIAKQTARRSGGGRFRVTIRQGRAGDLPMQSELVSLLPRLRRFAVSLTRNGPDADDLVQEPCIKAMANAQDWDRAQGLDRWVFRILRNHWISELRKRQVRLGQGHVDVHETEELVTKTTAEHDLAARQVMGRLAGLPPAFSSALLLVAVEGYSYKEAAEILDIPQGTVMSRISRARALLADQLALVGGV
jgi:RNA polymerase sigma-70 factor (ECF subfamily)